jgi:hypothetical protein
MLILGKFKSAAQSKLHKAPQSILSNTRMDIYSDFDPNFRPKAAGFAMSYYINNYLF